MLTDRKILLVVTGGIAAYKAIDLASRLKKLGAKVRTILTKSALEFVGEINFRAITGEPTYTDQFDLAEPIAHITLADWADIMVIAPATANIIGKMANGIGDDLATSTILAFHKPILVIPAMNVNMYNNKAVQDNIERLQIRGINLMIPEKGMLACGYEGRGKYPPNEEIIPAILTYLQYEQTISSKYLITFGASQEDLDPMRFITNHSSGKMGIALARAAYLRGGDVDVIHSRISETLPYYLEQISKTLSAEEMFSQVKEDFTKANVIIMCAAVADYTPKIKEEQKIKKKEELSLELKRTQDILHYLGENKREGQILVGFAAESENLVENAEAKLKKKNLDLIIANNISVSQSERSLAYLITRDKVEEFQGTKFDLAHKIIDIIEAIKKDVNKY
ncbi:bifunctional phosphopantothenoylcysteine decarboxylase/phosphopantothenate--cysteine ligase CoaBC [bacterium]|nr:bifunctional phosphopantothenoylcysteine decarboxylase/phosphopantothenate--cysteine ligase CoaBC [bacterium]